MDGKQGAIGMDIPTICSADEANQWRQILAEARRALDRGQAQIFLVETLAMIDQAKAGGLERLRLYTEMASDDEGGSFVSVSVRCDYANQECEDAEDVESDLHDQLSEMGRDLYDSRFPEKSLDVDQFGRELAKAILGETEAGAWFAARESRAIAAATGAGAEKPRAPTL